MTIASALVAYSYCGNVLVRRFLLCRFRGLDAATTADDRRDPSLRSCRVTREDGAEKMEYTAENPANLLETLTGRVTLDLSLVR